MKRVCTRILVLAVLIVLLAPQPAFADTYTVSFQIPWTPVRYENSCETNTHSCAMVIGIPYNEGRVVGTIEARITIDGDHIHMDFAMNRRPLSLSAQDLKSYSGYVSTLRHQPEMMTLYFLNPATENDPGYGTPLVVRPPNSKLMTMAVGLKTTAKIPDISRPPEM